MPEFRRLTYKTPDGAWGIKGVSLLTCPARLYGAAAKLCDMESLCEDVYSAKDAELTLDALQELVGEGVLPRETEIPEEPRKAVKKRFDEETARMLYEEGLDDAAIAKATGTTAHTVAKWRSRNGLRKKVRKPRMKKQMDVPGTKPSEEAAPGAGVQKIPIVGEAVEVTEPDFTKSAAPEPRTVTVEELRALLEDACKGGLGECAVLVEGTAFADLWLDVHSTLRIYESGERTVELKGTAKSA